MKQNIAQRWTAALRSKKFTQTTGYLHVRDKDADVGYCCLGVLCELAREDGVIIAESDAVEGVVRYGHPTDSGDRSATNLPAAVLHWAGMNGEELPDPIYDEDDSGVEYTSLAGLNDDARYDFEQIANIIDDQWTAL